MNNLYIMQHIDFLNAYGCLSISLFVKKFHIHHDSVYVIFQAILKDFENGYWFTLGHIIIQGWEKNGAFF